MLSHWINKIIVVDDNGKKWLKEVETLEWLHFLQPEHPLSNYVQWVTIYQGFKENSAKTDIGITGSLVVFLCRPGLATEEADIKLDYNKTLQIKTR